MIKVLKLTTGEEVVGHCSRKSNTITVKNPCAVMLITDKSTPDQHSMALIPYCAYVKEHKIEVDIRHVVWEAELQPDVELQYQSLTKSNIDIVKGEIPRSGPSTSTVSIETNL